MMLCTEIQERTRREKLLQDNQTKLQHSVQSLQHSVGLYRSSLVKVLQLLQLPPVSASESHHDEFVSASMSAIETRVLELLASSDAEKLLRSELDRRQDELSLRDSESAADNNFKISFRLFDVNDLALFLPTSAPGSDAQRVYLAFHLGCPHRFLSEESISSFSTNGRCVVPSVGVCMILEYLD